MANTELMVTYLVSGGFAGLACDITMYPVDTIKTRLQSSVGFVKSGGFNSIFRGLGSVALGSVPNNATFFLAYESSKQFLPKLIKNEATVHMVGACIGEVVSCCIRMPFEVVKQTAQAGGNFTTRNAFLHIVRSDGMRGLYSGFFSTLSRDVPYTVIQVPIWEFLKVKVAKHNNRKDVTAMESGLCGSLAGAFSAAITTPLDVAKTRIILLDRSSPNYTENSLHMIRHIYKQEGIFKLFSGISPRVLWLSLGGFIYFSAYDFAKSVICNNYFLEGNIYYDR